MRNPGSILVVTTGTEADRVLLDKAIRIARESNEQVHLYHCDDRQPRTISYQCSREAAERSWHASVSQYLAYLEGLKRESHPADVQISVDATCTIELNDAIIAKAAEVGARLLLRMPSANHILPLSPLDRQLMHRLPMTSMFATSRPWRSAPRFAALIDLADVMAPGAVR